MARRVVETKAKSFDHELLQVLIVYEEGKAKEDIKSDNPYSKNHGVLYQSAGNYEIKGLIGS